MEHSFVPEHDSHPENITQLASLILGECLAMQMEYEEHGISPPSLLAGTKSVFWSADAPKLIASRSKALGLLEKLVTLLQGPHDFLHEFVAPNWDHGALYAFLGSGALEYMATCDGHASLSAISNVSNIPEDKLQRILALLRCKNIVDEPEEGIFALTAVSEELVKDEDFRAWIEFQLFETRIASAHLSQALAIEPNDFESGSSAFAHGWGSEMYDWHSKHPEKGDRFRRAMRGVSKSLDPADSLLQKHIPSHEISSQCTKIVEVGGRYGFASVSLIEERPNLSFEVLCDSRDLLQRGAALVQPSSKKRITFTEVASLQNPRLENDSNRVFAYVIRNVLWNWSDGDVIKLLQALIHASSAMPSTRILVTDGVSPAPKQFPPHIEIAYRRRDITMMTMHNVKQRTQVEWVKLFAKVHPGLKIRTDFETSSHVCKALWDLRLEA